MDCLREEFKNMSLNISLNVDNDNLKFNIRLASYCLNCIDDDYRKTIIKENCDICNNKRIELTDNGMKILGLIQSFGTDKIDLKDLVDREKYPGYYNK
jgi:hypothetical protein